MVSDIDWLPHIPNHVTPWFEKVYALLKGKPLFHPMESGSHVGALAVVFGAFKFPPEELRQRGK
jgi:hypothetical protein